MSVKNAVRILIGRFGIVWGIMLFVTAYLIVLISVSLIFVNPIVEVFRAEGLFETISELFELMLGNAFTINNITEKITEIWNNIVNVYNSNTGIKINAFLLVTLVFTLLNKFLIGFYELPVLDCLDHKMSANAKLPFFGRFLANLKRSLLFVLIKMLFAIIADIIIAVIIFGLFKLWGINTLLTLFLPLIIIAVLILLLAFRFSLFSGWGPAVITGKKKIFPAFKESVTFCFNNFGRCFGGMVIAWLFIFVVNFLFGLLTFGAALIITIPASMAFICALNMTIYYANTGRKYYITDEHIQQEKI